MFAADDSLAFNQLSDTGTFAAYALFWINGGIQVPGESFATRQFIWGNLDDAAESGWGIYLEPDADGQLQLVAGVYAASGLRTAATILSTPTAPSFVERLIVAGLWYDGTNLALSINGIVVDMTEAVDPDAYVPSALPVALGGDLAGAAPATDVRIVSAGCAPVTLAEATLGAIAGAHFNNCREAYGGGYVEAALGHDWAHRYEASAAAVAGSAGTISRSAAGVVLTSEPVAPATLSDLGNRGPARFDGVTAADLARLGAGALQLVDVACADWYRGVGDAAAPVIPLAVVASWDQQWVAQTTQVESTVVGGVPPYTYAWTRPVTSLPGSYADATVEDPFYTHTQYNNGFTTARITVTDSLLATAQDDVNISRTFLWTTRASPAGLWADVTWAAPLGLLVAVGGFTGGDQIMTSPDGVVWTPRAAPAYPLGEEVSWSAICWASALGLLVAVGTVGATPSAASRVMTSPDGITWTLRPTPANLELGGVCWSPNLGLLVATGINTLATATAVATSPDGVVWTAQNTPAPAVTPNWVSPVWASGLGLFVAVNLFGSLGGGLLDVMTSPDGVTWTFRSAASNRDWSGLAWAPTLGLLLALSPDAGGQAMSSPDGVTWTTRAIAARVWNDAAWSPELNVFSLIAQTTAVRFGYSFNGTSLFAPPGGGTFGAGLGQWQSQCWAPELGYFVAVGYGAGGGAGPHVMTGEAIVPHPP